MTEFSWHPVWLSLQVAGAALVLAFCFGTAAAWLMAVRRFRGQVLIEAVFLLPLVLPPTVTGFALLVLAGRHGWLGRLLSRFNFQLLFTPSAAVLAAAVVAFPLMYQSAKAAFLAQDPALRDAARSLGAPPARVFWTVTIPLARPGLLAGAVLAFARALGEFGATVMVAGNIPGVTTTMTTAIYLAAGNGDLRVAGIYAALLAAVNFAFIAGLNFSTERGHRARKI